MKHVNLATVDLNLLKTFLAIWEFRSLTVAADKLNLSQPAVSHALRRLRETFDDPLFVRTPTAMVPTDAALRLYGPIDHAMGIIYGALQRHSHFDPANTARAFRLSMSDMAVQYVLPQLMEVLAVQAPAISIEVRQMPMDELCTSMRSGDTDIALGYLPALNDECINHSILVDEYVCVVRDKHPQLPEHVTIEDLNKLRYVYAENDTTGHVLVDNIIQGAGIHRDVALRLPHFTVAAGVVASTSLALIAPRSIVEKFPGDFRIIKLPFSTPSISVRVYTHSRFASDPGIAWLTSTIISTLTSS